MIYSLIKWGCPQGIETIFETYGLPFYYLGAESLSATCAPLAARKD